MDVNQRNAVALNNELIKQRQTVLQLSTRLERLEIDSLNLRNELNQLRMMTIAKLTSRGATAPEKAQ